MPLMWAVLSHTTGQVFFLASSICTPTLIQGKLERTETNLMHFMWEVTWTHRNRYSNTFLKGQLVNSHFGGGGFMCELWAKFGITPLWFPITFRIINGNHNMEDWVWRGPSRTANIPIHTKLCGGLQRGNSSNYDEKSFSNELNI